MSMEDDVRKQHASLEETVREQHFFDEKVRQFLALAASLTNKELEIALARLADTLEKNQESADTLKTKGAILNAYYKLRVLGEKQQSLMSRTKENFKAGGYRSGVLGEHLIQKISDYRVPVLPSAEAYASNEPFVERIKLLAP